MNKDSKQPPTARKSTERRRPAQDTVAHPEGITRREFLQSSAVLAGMGLGMGELLSGCHSSSDNVGANTETRTYLFDFSQMDTSQHDIVMVAGRTHATLVPITAGKLREFRADHPILEALPDERITHWIELEMPAEGLQLCYCQRISHTATDGSWDMAMLFYHFPVAALHSARARQQGMLGAGELPQLPVKWGRYGVTAEQLASLGDPVGEDMFKDCTTTATSMVAGYPEISCGEPTSATYIQNSIVGTQPQTQQLGEVLEALGPATPQANWQSCGDPIQENATGWGTLIPVCNPDTQQQATNSQTGALQYIPVWAADTNAAAKDAITPALTTVKGDTTLGVNVTTTPENTSGIIWTQQDGATTVDQTTNSASPMAADLGYITRDQSPGHGYSVTVTDVAQDTGNSAVEALVTFTAKNWFVRYLSLYVRFLDENGDPIPLSTVVSELGDDTVSEYFPLNSCCSVWNDANDMLLGILGPEFEVLGMPVSSKSATFTVPLPTSATSILILGGGMGNQSESQNPFYTTTIPGAVMTGVFDLAVPTLFLSLNAAAGIASLTESLAVDSTLVTILPLTLDLFATELEAVGFNDPAAFKSLGINIGETLLRKSAAPLMTLMANALTEGETQEDLLDAIPLIGGFLSAITAIGTVAQMAETAAQVAQSPSTYVYEITLTHDIQVTINPDPTDPAGFPATATFFTVLAQFDGKGTPTTITQNLPATQTTTPQVVTFTGVPLGGNVTVNVGFYSDDDWLAGQGAIGPVANSDALSLVITITENMVPLQPTTVYSHKEVIKLNDSDDHVWFATTTPPAETAPSGCNPVDGQLCQLTGITVNTTAAGVGYSFQSYNSAVTNCTDGAQEQLHQFANISITQDPQSDYLFSGCGFGGTARVVYDLLGKSDFNFYLDPSTTGPDFNGVIRQVRLGSSDAGIDGPTSNKAWGKLQFPSDALLLHPAGQIVSINSSVNKIEVITLPDAAVADDVAPLSQAYGGGGIRPGLMDGPTLAALAPDGTILVLESANNRIQAFDLNANAVPKFQKAYFFPLKQQTVTQYLSFAVEYTGYMYVLSKAGAPGSETFTLDIYTPQGGWLTSTTGLVAARLAVNYWRDIFAENFQVLELPDGSLPARTEPSISHWIPSTP
jgi:hypothetical protein